MSKKTKNTQKHALLNKDCIINHEIRPFPTTRNFVTDIMKEGKRKNIVYLTFSVDITHTWDLIQFYDNMANEVLGISPPHILLLHENDLAALYIDDLIAFLNEKGLDIITPDEAYESQIANRIPDVLINNQGRIAAIAVEQGYEGSLRHESESPEYLDSLFEAYNVFSPKE